ncbi:hypothetical protein EDD86DRAFT_197797 [Gorgonomyces haynaldii]|nr:hypothetical protein EDD86DRAFT_197797 [Gorgonomyces haynaldii]
MKFGVVRRRRANWRSFRDLSLLMDHDLLYSILAGTSLEPVTKRQFVEYSKTVSMDYENIAFYDAVVTYSIMYDHFWRQLHPSDQVDPDTLAHILCNTGSKTKKRILANHSKLDPEWLFLIDRHCSSDEELWDYTKEASVHIYNSFLWTGSPNEVNVSGGLKRKIKLQIQAGKDLHPGIFKWALEEVLLNISQNLLPRFKQQQVLTNIGPGEIQRRWFLFLVGFFLSLIGIVLLWTIGFKQSTYYRVLMWPPLHTMFAGWAQWRSKFCFIHAAKGTYNPTGLIGKEYVVKTEDQCARETAHQYSHKLFAQVLLAGLVSTVVLMGIPPYRF